MSDNQTPTEMIDAVLAGLPKLDGDDDVAMTSAPDDDLEPGQIPPWEDVMDVPSTGQAAEPEPAKSKSTPTPTTKPVDSKPTLTPVVKPVDSKSTPTPTPNGVSALPKPSSAQGGRSMSTALSVSSTPHSNRAPSLPKSATPNGPQRNVSGIFSFNGSPSPNTMPVANNRGVGRPMGALVFRPNATTTAPSSPRNIPTGPAKQSPSRRGQGVGPGVPQAPKGPGQGNGFGFQGPNNRPSQGQSQGHSLAQSTNRPSQGAVPGPPQAPNRPSQGVSHGPAQVSNRPSQGAVPGPPQAPNRPSQGVNQGPSQRNPVVQVPNQGPAPTAVLSRECQKRHFNPEWNVYPTEGGRFGCDVKVGNMWVRGQTTWKDTISAKYAMAREALPLVKGLSVTDFGTEMHLDFGHLNFNGRQLHLDFDQGGGSIKSSSVFHVAPHAIKKEKGVPNNTSRAQTAVKQQQGHSLYTPPSRREQTGNQGNRGPKLNNTGVDGALMSHLQNSLGVSMPSHSNPEVAKAFLEGIAVGSRLGASLDGITRGRRGNSRSRSPAASRRADRYRIRSPPPNARIRSPPPPLYDDFPGRPNSDHYRPTDSAIPRERPRAAVPQYLVRPAPVGNSGIDGESWGHDGYYRMNRIKTERQD